MSPPDLDGQSSSSPLILVVDDQAIIRDPIRECIQSAGYAALSAASGQEALELLENHRPSLIVLDVHMPGMDGMALLSALRMKPATANVPVILLTVERDKSIVLQASKLGVRDYILKTRFSLKELLDRIGRYFSADDSSRSGPASSSGKKQSSPMAPVASREDLLGRAQSALRGRTLSGTVTQVITLAASPRGSNAELAELIVRDPMLCANVLRVANSAAYASAQGLVTTIPDAIRKIGCAAVGRIAAAIAVIDSMPQSLSDGFNPVRAWQHSFAVAQLCQMLAGEASGVGGVAYLVGLCHDVADILLRARFSEEYQQVLQVQQSTGARLGEVERSMLGITQAEMVPMVLEHLGLPQTISAPILSFHLAISAGRIPTEPLAQVLYLAELYANGLLLASSASAAIAPLTQALCMKVTGTPQPAAPDPAALRSEVYCLTAILARLSAKEDATLATPLLPKRKLRIRLCRDASFSDFDPLAAALSSLAEVQVTQQLPSLEEAGCYDGLVVAVCNSWGIQSALEAQLASIPKGNSGLPPLVLADPSLGKNIPQAAFLPTTLSALSGFIDVLESRAAQRAA